jgi:hypothetical protein
MSPDELMVALNKAIEAGPVPKETATQRATRLAEFLPGGMK